MASSILLRNPNSHYILELFDPWYLSYHSDRECNLGLVCKVEFQPFNRSYSQLMFYLIHGIFRTTRTGNVI